jgi:hypothetical protein
MFSQYIMSGEHGAIIISPFLRLLYCLSGFFLVKLTIFSFLILLLGNESLYITSKESKLYFLEGGLLH